MSYSAKRDRDGDRERERKREKEKEKNKTENSKLKMFDQYYLECGPPSKNLTYRRRGKSCPSSKKIKYSHNQTTSELDNIHNISNYNNNISSLSNHIFNNNNHFPFDKKENNKHRDS